MRFCTSVPFIDRNKLIHSYTQYHILGAFGLSTRLVSEANNKGGTDAPRLRGLFQQS